MPNSTRWRRQAAQRLGLDPAGLDLTRCAYCPTVKPWGELTLDHVVPQCMGGSKSGANTVFACDACNHARDEHHKHCQWCVVAPGACLKAMIWRLPSLSVAKIGRGGSWPCLLSLTRSRRLRFSVLRTFSLAGMVRTGRDYLRLDTKGDPWVSVPDALCGRRQELGYTSEEARARV